MFTGKELDQETGLYYFGARYLDPQTSRWMSVDPAGADLINPMEVNQKGELVAKNNYSVIESLNWYSFCRNNPVKYTDPTGEFVLPALLVVAKIAAPYVIGGAIVIFGSLSQQTSSGPEASEIPTPNTGEKIQHSLLTRNRPDNSDRERETNAIRVQLQTGRDTPSSAIRENSLPSGVTKVQGYSALMELYTKTLASNPGLAKSAEFQGALIKMSQKIKDTPGISGGGNVMRETFNYNGTNYRIDLENLRGINLVE